MYKYITAIILTLGVVLASEAQVVVKWDELNKEWFINSGGYPSDEPSLDSLYYRLHDFALTLKPDGTYRMEFSKDKVETGKFETDRKKRELILTEDKTGKKLSYSVAELTPELLTLTISERYSWAYYLSLTSHR